MRSIAVIATSVALGVFGLTATASAQTPAPSSSTTTTTTVSPDVKTTWEKIKGGWHQTKGSVKEQWGKLTDDDLTEIEGRREKLVGKIQARYGVTKEQAESQVSGWERHYKSM